MGQAHNSISKANRCSTHFREGIGGPRPFALRCQVSYMCWLPVICSKLEALSHQLTIDRPYEPSWDLRFCQICAALGHEGRHCPRKTQARCGICSGPHMSRVCPGLEPKQCPTCKGAHEAWSIFCRAPAIVSARRQCVDLRTQGAS